MEVERTLFRFSVKVPAAGQSDPPVTSRSPSAAQCSSSGLRSFCFIPNAPDPGGYMKKFATAFALAAMFCGTAVVASADEQTKQSSHADKNQKTIVEIAAGNEDFSTLVTAVKAAGLAEALSGKGPLTVFAPTNEAFKKLPAGALENLLKPENKDQLAAVLKYHVASGAVKAADVVKVDSVKTLQGDEVEVQASNGTVMLNGKAKVVKTDIMASNGVIHVIDTVLLPTSK